MKLQMTQLAMNEKYFTKLLWSSSTLLVRDPMVGLFSVNRTKYHIQFFKNVGLALCKGS